MKKFLVFLCGMLLVLSVAGIAKAVPIDIENWNFEDLDLGDGDSTKSIPGWTLGDDLRQGTWNPRDSVYLVSLPSEANVAYLHSSLVEQYLVGEELVPYATYILEAEVGHGQMPFGAYKVLFGIGDPDTPSSFVPLAWDANTLTVPSGGFITSTVIYTADPDDSNLLLTEGRKLRIQLYNEGAVGTTQVTYDNVRLDMSPVPEPATMLLVGSGLIGLAALGRKKFFKKG